MSGLTAVVGTLAFITSVCCALSCRRSRFDSERAGGSIPAAHKVLARIRRQDPAGACSSPGQLSAYCVTFFQVNAVGFLGVSQPLLPSGLKALTNIQIAAADEPYPKISELVLDMEMRRDVAEDRERARIIELELKLLQAENDIIKEVLQRDVGRMLAR